MSVSEFENIIPDLEGLDERELRDLIERATRVEELTRHPGWNYFKDYLIALTAASQRKVILGACEDLEVYRFETGKIAGLSLAIEAPEMLLEQVKFRQEIMADNNEGDDLSV